MNVEIYFDNTDGEETVAVYRLLCTTVRDEHMEIIFEEWAVDELLTPLSPADRAIANELAHEHCHEMNLTNYE